MLSGYVWFEFRFKLGLWLALGIGKVSRFRLSVPLRVIRLCFPAGVPTHFVFYPVVSRRFTEVFLIPRNGTALIAFRPRFREHFWSMVVWVRRGSVNESYLVISFEISKIDTLFGTILLNDIVSPTER